MADSSRVATLPGILPIIGGMKFLLDFERISDYEGKMTEAGDPLWVAEGMVGNVSYKP